MNAKKTASGSKNLRNRNKMSNSNKHTEKSSLRLQVYLARAGFGSRRGCEKIIESGRVQINGTVVKEHGHTVSSDDEIRVDGKTVPARTRFEYIALNKPQRYICTNYDPEGRPKAIDLLKGKIDTRIFTIGRLDYLSSGLILLTNDGDFAAAVSHPSRKVPKEYILETREQIQEQHLQQYMHGVTIDNQSYRLVEYSLIHTRKVRLTLHEGKNRELRKVFGFWNYKVKRIHRVRIGPVTIGNLKPGEHRYLTQKEVAFFFNKG
jgi:23S rRNA pseudouridine2605 synthase